MPYEIARHYTGVFNQDEEEGGYDEPYVLNKVFSTVDFPLSSIADTVVLPISIPMENHRRENCQCNDRTTSTAPYSPPSKVPHLVSRVSDKGLAEATPAPDPSREFA